MCVRALVFMQLVTALLSFMARTRFNKSQESYFFPGKVKNKLKKARFQNLISRLIPDYVSLLLYLNVTVICQTEKDKRSVFCHFTTFVINIRYCGFFAEDCFRFTWVLYNCHHILQLLFRRLVLSSSARLIQSGCQNRVQCLALDKILSFRILWVKDNNFRLYLYLALSSLFLLSWTRQTAECSLCAPDHHIAFSLLHPLLWITFLVISILKPTAKQLTLS